MVSSVTYVEGRKEVSSGPFQLQVLEGGNQGRDRRDRVMKETLARGLEDREVVGWWCWASIFNSWVVAGGGRLEYATGQRWLVAYQRTRLRSDQNPMRATVCSRLLRRQRPLTREQECVLECEGLSVTLLMSSLGQFHGTWVRDCWTRVSYQEGCAHRVLTAKSPPKLRFPLIWRCPRGHIVLGLVVTIVIAVVSISIVAVEAVVFKFVV